MFSLPFNSQLSQQYSAAHPQSLAVWVDLPTCQTSVFPRRDLQLFGATVAYKLTLPLSAALSCIGLARIHTHTSCDGNIPMGLYSFDAT